MSILFIPTLILVLKILSSTVLLPKNNFKTPLVKFIKALEEVKNGHTKTKRLGLLACVISCISKIIKSIGK